MTVSVVTPTCDRPVGFALAEQWMARQTRQPDEWIVADGGTTPVRCILGQTHLWKPEPPGLYNLAHNLRAALARVTGDMVIIWEDDDWYAPTHLAQLLSQLRPDILLAGDNQQRYYNLAARRWRTYVNKGACLSQTAFPRSLIPMVLRAVTECEEAGSYGIDGRLWASIPHAHWSLEPAGTVVGLKGLPGQPGLGVGHRPVLKDRLWKRDPGFDQLRAWVGADAEVYLRLMGHRP